MPGVERLAEVFDGRAFAPPHRHDTYAIRITPALILAALSGRPLTFVADPVVATTAVDPVLQQQGLADLDALLGDLGSAELISRLADMLAGWVARPHNRPQTAGCRSRHWSGCAG